MSDYNPARDEKKLWEATESANPLDRWPSRWKRQLAAEVLHLRSQLSAAQAYGQLKASQLNDEVTARMAAQAERDAAVRLLREMHKVVKDVPALQGREYIALGTAVLAAIDAAAKT